MPDISPKMKKGIAMCEEILGVKFQGSTFEEAHTFLDENLPKCKDKDIREYRRPSDKMISAITWIQQVTGEPYHGKTMKDASEYIERNLEKARASSGQSYKKKGKKK